MNNFSRQLLLCPLLLCMCGAAYVQPARQHNHSFGLQAAYGTFLTHLPKAAYLRDSWSWLGEAYWQRQTDGSKAWHRANGLPQWGVAVFFGHTGSRQYMGSMAGAFPFVNLGLVRRRQFTSALRAGTGLGWIQKPYDKTDNHKNVLIGSRFNAYISFLWKNEFRLAPGIYANAGLGFSHFSNGSSTLPNLGLNIPSFSAGLRYGGGTGVPPTAQRDSFNSRVSVSLYASAGLKQFPWIEGRRYLVNTVLAEAGRQFRTNSRYAGGLAVYYDRSMEVDPRGLLSNKRKGNKVQAGIYAGYEHLFGRLSVPLQVGAYVLNRDIYSALFQQIGFRYRLNRRLQAQLLMKTHSGKADFIHVGLGYQFK